MTTRRTGRGFGGYVVAFRSAALVAVVATPVVRAIRQRPASRRPPAMATAASAPGV